MACCTVCRVRKAYRLGHVDIADLARALNVTEASLLHWINKKGPPPPNSKRVEDYLDAQEVLTDGKHSH